MDYTPRPGDRIRITRYAADGTRYSVHIGLVLAVKTLTDCISIDFRDDNGYRRDIAHGAFFTRIMQGWTQTITPEQQ
jgi:hypothetical protein